MQLFNTEEPTALILPGGRIDYYSNFFNPEESLRLFDTLLDQTEWRQDDIKLFGKTYPQPRLTALYGNNAKTYTYSGITMHPLPFTEELLKIKKKVEAVSKKDFTTCLLNLYRDGQDSNGWHADNEPELGKNPVIASVSFGAQRWFHLKHRTDKALKTKLLLENGSLLLMKGETQHHWLHQVPKTKKQIGARINLTFRTIV
ncbi:alpha-ketoglutarate-dependent dioxygenase AlkB [Leptobacterium flavescens]|uniref:Alpha-ketoglutarate-dependent dioxygenase AlkB n=1 Tax=Leptobacterium flavescens TaxID=472055 RepID=A0A6P0UGA4_9FLAO|nr:alpha-ketoglutarate-dependent dioxygenase AlkB [Leptobacterium flavescens]NER12274.1 alpha-ketoglutarate-dependent dioxygenase AlkB [Leptobacterium flavescens]